MQKKRFLVGIIFLFVPLLLAGCGIAQEQYDAVLADLSTAQGELQSVKAELGTAQADVSELTASLEKANSELEAMQNKNLELTSSLEKAETELEAAQAELETTKKELEALDTEYEAFESKTNQLWTDLDENLALNHYVIGINYAILKNDLDGIRTGCSLMTGQLKVLDDTELQSLWETAYVDGEDWILYHDPFAALMEIHSKRISDKARVLRDKLSE